MKMKNRLHRYNINRPRLDMDTNIVNVKNTLLWWYLYVLSNTYAVFEAQLMKSLNNIGAGWKESFAYKTNVYYNSVKVLIEHSYHAFFSFSD